MIELIKYVVGMFAEKQDQVKYDICENGKMFSLPFIFLIFVQASDTVFCN